jgi:DNA-binding MurR/RpiR family transcriptional regulator
MPNATRRAPPESLEQLRSLVIAMQSRKSDLRLGVRAARALVRIVDAPGQTAICSISEVAAAAGVNASTLTRLSKRLGYSGFNEFQDVFRQHVADQQHFYSDQARRLLRGGGKPAPTRSIAERIAEDETANIAGALQDLDADTLGAAAQLLIAARRVRAYGARQMHAVAYFLSYGLGMLRSDVGLLGSSEHGMAHGLAQLEQGDALIVVGCTPNTRGTVDTARTAAGEGMDVIALTDSHASPLAAVARYTFVCDTGGSYFSNSSAALIVLAEILLTTLAERLGARTVQQLRRREALISQLGVEF